MTVPPAEVQAALVGAAAAGDRAALAAALDGYGALAGLNGRRADGMARDFTILRQAAPAMGQALAQQGAAGLARAEELAAHPAFCLGVMGLAHHPTLGVRDPGRPAWLTGILRGWAADPDERARWIVAEALGRKWTRGCLDAAEALLRVLADDESRLVRRQAAASLKANAGYRAAAGA